MDLGLAGAAVCVQGGTKGMGRAAAECFARDGARVVVLARGQEGIDETVEALRRLGSPDAWGVARRPARPATIDAAFAEIASRWGELNTLVNAAGPGRQPERPSTRSPTTSGAPPTSSARSPPCAARAPRCRLLRKAAWARVVNVSAHSTKRQSEPLAAYTAAKAAMTSISKNMSLALAKEEILVNTVSPGSFASASFKAAMRQPARQSAVSTPRTSTTACAGSQRTSAIPAHMPRAGDPAEIGPVIAFVGSRANSYMTGANINVDGGSDFT